MLTCTSPETLAGLPLFLGLTLLARNLLFFHSSLLTFHSSSRISQAYLHSKLGKPSNCTRFTSGVQHLCPPYRGSSVKQCLPPQPLKKTGNPVVFSCLPLDLLLATGRKAFEKRRPSLQSIWTLTPASPFPPVSSRRRTGVTLSPKLLAPE